MFCTRCGSKMEEHQRYCSTCGYKAKNEEHSVGTTGVGELLSEFSLILARCFLNIIIALLILFGGLVGCMAVLVSIYSFYCFGVQKAFVIPSVIASGLGMTSITGVYLIFTGIATLIIAILFMLSVSAVIKGIKQIKWEQ